MWKIRKLKIKKTSHEASRRRIENCPFWAGKKAEGYKFESELLFATDPQYKNGKKVRAAKKNYLSISNKSSSSRVPVGRLKGLNADGC